MAKRTAKRGRKAKPAKKRAPVKASPRRPAARKAAPKKKARKAASKRRASARKPAVSKKRPPKTAPRAKRQAKASAAPRLARPVRLDRARRTLEEEMVPTPPSSLDMNRRGSSVRSGRAGVAGSLSKHNGMSPELTGGDVDANWENAYFSGDEAPGGDNPTPDQEVVEDIGRSLGVEYQDNEELKSTDKIAERDRKRWEYDPASSEDYKDRK